MWTRRLTQTLLAIGAFVIATATPAQAYLTCTWKVAEVIYYPESGAVFGRFSVEGQPGQEIVGLCTTGATVTHAPTGRQIKPEQCGYVYSQVLAAQVAGKKVKVWFYDDVVGDGGGSAPTCDTIWNFNIATAQSLHRVDILE